LRVSYVE
jgi:hypothetical protein